VEYPEELQNLERGTAKLDAPIPGTRDLTYVDATPDPGPLQDEHLDDDKLQDAVARLVRTLPDGRERHILVRYYGIDGKPGQTMQDIGRGLGITRQRVEQLLAKAMRQLRMMDLGVCRQMLAEMEEES